MPPASMLTVIIAVGLAELEAIEPGFIDRMIERLGEASLRTAVIKLRGPRAGPEVMAAQGEALEWLTVLAPMLRAAAGRRKRKGKRG